MFGLVITVITRSWNLLVNFFFKAHSIRCRSLPAKKKKDQERPGSVHGQQELCSPPQGPRVAIVCLEGFPLSFVCHTILSTSFTPPPPLQLEQVVASLSTSLLVSPRTTTMSIELSGIEHPGLHGKTGGGGSFFFFFHWRKYVNIFLSMSTGNVLSTDVLWGRGGEFQ